MAINIKNSQEQVLDDIPKIISSTSLMDKHNPAEVISVRSKKRRKKRAKNMAMNNKAIPIEDQLDDSLEASNKVGHCEVATNDSPKNLLEKVLSVEPLAELCKMDAGFTENLSEGNANTKIEDKVQSMDPKITPTTSLMDLHNPAGDISMSSKKRRRRAKKKAINNNGPQIEDQVDDNLKAPNKIGDSEVPNRESQKNLLETVLTPQPQADHPKMDGGLTANLAIVNNNAIRIDVQLDHSLEASNKVGHCEVATNDSPKNLREKVLSSELLSEHRKMDAGFAENLSKRNANTKIEDEVQSMDPKITLTSSLMDLHNPAGDISMSSKKRRRRAKKKATNNNGPQIEDQVDDNLKAPNRIGDCEVPYYESQKNLLETVLTPQPLVEHPKIILSASLMETPNPAGYNSLRSKKNTGNQVDENMEASNKTGDCEVAHHDSQMNLLETVLSVQPLADHKNLLETVLTVQPLAEQPKIDGGLTENLPEGNANSKKRKWQKRIKKKTEIKDDVQSMDPKIISSTSLMETLNFAGDNSVSIKKNSNDQVFDNLEASKKVGDCEVANNESQKNLFETGLTVQPLADHKNLLATVSTVQPVGRLTENLPEGNANSKKIKWQKRIKKKTEIKDDVQSMDPKIISSTSLMETHNFAGDNSVSIKKNSKDQVVDNLEASKNVGDCEVSNNDSQKNLFETGLTVQPLADHKNLLATASTVQPVAKHPTIDGRLTENLPEGNANSTKRKWQKRIKKKTEIKDDVQSMDPKIISSTSLMETHNFAGDNSVCIKKNSNDQVVDNLEASKNVGDCEVANNDSQKNPFETGLTVQSLAEHPKLNGGLPENLSEGNVNSKKRKKRKKIKKKTRTQDEVQNLLETVSTVQPLAEHPKIDGGLTENLLEGNAYSKKKKWQKRIKKKTEFKDDVQSMDPNTISSTSLMETHNFSGDNSVSIKKNSNDQVVVNLEASKKVGDCELANNDSQKNLFETGLTVQSLAEHPKMDGRLPDNLSEGNVNSKKRKKRKRIKKKTGIKDEVLSMDLKILLNSSLTETQNPSGDNSLSSEKNTRDLEDDNMEAANRTEFYEVAHNDSQKNVLETVLTVQPLAEHTKMDGGLPENLSEGHANGKKRKWQKRIKKKTEIKEEVSSVDPKIILNTSPMEMQNSAGYNSLSSKKYAGNQVDDNLESSNKPGDWDVANNDSQKNLETVLTIQPLAEPPKVDSGLTTDLPEGSANSKKRKRRKRIKRKVDTKDEVQSMDPKIILSTSLMETQNPAGDNSLSSKRNNGDHVNDNLEASNIIGDCEVAHNDSQKILLETVSTEQPLAEHPKMDELLTANLSEGNASSRKRKMQKIKKKTEIEDGVQSMGQEEAILSVRVDVSSNEASSKLLDERSRSLVRLVELEMKKCPCESEQRPPSDQRAGENGKFENESNEVNFENIVMEETTHLCSFDVMKAECLPKDLDQFPNTASITASSKKLLVLDVNGLLAHIVMPAPKDCRGDVHILGRAIFKRPFCDDFLKFCFQNFDVGIWSSRTKKIIDRVVDYLLGDLKEKLLFCWDMSHSTQTGFKTLENTYKPLVCKELRKIWENDDPNFPWKKGDYDESNTLLLDDSPYKALLNPLHTAIFPPSYQYTDKKDNSIGPGGDIRVYLEGLLASGNVREYVGHHPFGQSAINETNVSWEFYSRVLHTMSNNLGNNHPIPVPTLS